MTPLTQKIVERLTDDYRFKLVGEHLREGVCPNCGKKSLWTWKNSPGVVQCNRQSKCGFYAHSKELLPDLFIDLDKQYPKTDTHPNATADAYLALVRGFKLDLLRGSYSQNEYWHPHGQRGSTSVRFYLSLADGVYWERLIDDVTITHDDGTQEVRNKNFKGAFKGLWWQPPGQKLEAHDTVYLTEGIFDAIALWQNGLKACAIMSAGSLPKEAIEPLLGLKITWVLALDNDLAGRKFTRKHVDWFKSQEQKVSAMFSSEDSSAKLDWNDLHQRQALDKNQLRQYRYYGKLELVTQAVERARLMFEHSKKEQCFFTFSHFNCMYRCAVDKGKYDRAAAELGDNSKTGDKLPSSFDEVSEGAFFQSAEVTKEANVNIRLLHILESEIGDDPLYSMHIDFDNGSPSRIIYLTGNSFSSPTEFKKSIMVKAPGAQVTASAKSLDYRFAQWFRKKPMTVKTLDYAGYHRDTDAYIFNRFAVQAGKIIPVNADDFFELKETGIKTSVDIKQKLTEQNPIAFLNDFVTAYGVGGLVALSWWVGTLYVEQIRKDYRSYPFFEVIGEAGSGKTDMVNFLWKLYGKQGDAFNPNSSTLPGRMRKMAQVSNLPIVFNETDNETTAENNHAKKFNWDEQKDLFDGQMSRHTGTKTMDNQTRMPLFRGALCVTQNIPVDASEAILSRFLHLQFDRAHHTPAGKIASDKLNNLDITEVSGFLLHSATKAKAVLARFKERFPIHVATLQNNDKITMRRIIDNHAMIMAMADCLPLLLNINPVDVAAVHASLVQMAEARQERLKKDSPRVELFWENFNYLNNRFDGEHTEISCSNAINHHPESDDYVAVNLVEYFKLARDRGLDQIPTFELHKILPSSVVYEFVAASKVITSSRTGKATRCYIFKTPDKVARDRREAAERKAKLRK